ncbi:short subunit dehydrogenase [Comamonas sp. BIGb0124]|uniref:SDR family NAD(P)-dependent oxidoreductase n=1 Tax=Comamonas sp. BIGb0124 TaxID=2485130 RepID=UPI000F4AD285|nr:SDR family NAD(P)-dependent oxidoreductase [Comamonas sp. BIGb0124]ROR24741.1 short subunit dehydrogenase [Comamonas sp. BIGb0124]
MNRLNEKVALVMGAGRGIGRATAKLFASEGAKVAVLSRTQTQIDAVVSEIAAAGGTAIGIRCDISEAEQILSAVDKVVTTWGAIDILVNNALDSSVVFSTVGLLPVSMTPC